MDVHALRGWVASARVITVLTGAGMSAESGVPTFRDALTGLWARFDPQELATEAAAAQAASGEAEDPDAPPPGTRPLAEAVLAAPQPSLLFAGAFHVRRDLGVPLHLADLGGATGTQVLILAEVGETVSAASADYVWYTPAQPEQDHCAKLRP